MQPIPNRRLEADEDGYCEGDSLQFNGQPNTCEKGEPEIGPFLMRFLKLVAAELQLKGHQVERMLGVTHSNLARLGDGGKKGSGGKLLGTSARRISLLAICIRTNMKATELALDTREPWAVEIDKLLANLGFRATKSKSLKSILKKEGIDWKKLRFRAKAMCQNALTATSSLSGSGPVEATAAQIQTMILSGKLARSAHVDVPQLAWHVDQSRSVVQQALQKLNGRRLVGPLQGPDGGTKCLIARPTQSEATEIMQLRSLLETALLMELGTNPKNRRKTLQTMHSSFKSMSAAFEGNDTAAFVEGDVDFHLASAQDKPLHRDILKDLLTIVRAAHPVARRLRSAQSAALRSHEAIISHLEEGEFETAAKELQEHLSTALSYLSAAR